MSGSGIYDASGVLISEVGRNYVGGAPNPVDGDLMTDQIQIQNFKNNTVRLGHKI